MPKVSGIFDLFENIETTNVEEFNKWLKPPANPIILQNFVANRVFYPQIVPISVEEMIWEEAILREALKKSPSFINLTARKILIPQSFTTRIPDLSKLVWIFVDAYLLEWTKNNPGQNVWTVILRHEERDEVIGSIIIPEFSDMNGSIDIVVNNKNVQVPKGGLAVIPCETMKCKIGFKLSKGILLGTKEGMVEIYGGKLGLVVDGR